MAEAVRTDAVSSNYSPELAPKTWRLIRGLRRGTAVFTMPAGPIKCAGAPQKIAYLACDWWRSQGVLRDIEVVLVLPTPAVFGVPEFARILDGVVARYGIDLGLQREMTAVDPQRDELTLTDRREGGGTSGLHYDLLHVVPPQSAPDWLKGGPLTDPGNPAGYVTVDNATHQHVRLWLLKRRGLPFLYWNLMLKGRA